MQETIEVLGTFIRDALPTPDTWHNLSHIQPRGEETRALTQTRANALNHIPV